MLLLPRLIALPTGSNPEALFHSTWFVESVLSATLVVLVLRTRLPFFKSMPSHLMLAATVVIAVIAVALPYSPLAALFGFVPLPLSYLVIVFVIVVLYVLSAEFTKRVFYRLDQRMVHKLPGQ